MRSTRPRLRHMRPMIGTKSPSSGAAAVVGESQNMRQCSGRATTGARERLRVFSKRLGRRPGGWPGRHSVCVT
eukprot:192885-Prymnesium_polylepis.1